MYCRQCGRQLLVASRFCADCGSPAHPPERVTPIYDEEDYATKVSSEHQQSVPPPQPRPSAPLPQPKKTDWFAHVFAALCGVLVVVAALIGAKLFFGISVIAPSQFADNRQPPAHILSEQSQPISQPLQSAATQSPVSTPMPQPTQQAATAPRPPQNDPNPNEQWRNANVAPPRPNSRVVFSGTMQVSNLQYRYFQFSVPNEATLSGGFTAWGGNNDIDCLVMNANQFAGWQGLGRYYALYNSGYIHSGNINLRLPPGDYVLIFTNRQALVTSKSVQGLIQVTYD